MEIICPNCKHGRRQHSKEGCTWFDLKTGKECKCKVKYMDLK